MGRREDNKREKRSRLVAAGREQFGAQGFERASIEQIAKAAGVARGTFYLYFPDKLALLRALVQPWVDGLLGIVEQVDAALATPAVSVEQGFEAYQHMAMAIAMSGVTHREVVLVAFRENRAPGEAGEYLRGEEERVLQAFTAMTERAAERGWLHVEDPALAVRVIFGAVERLYFDVLSQPELDLQALEPMATGVVQLFTRALSLTMPQSSR